MTMTLEEALALICELPETAQAEAAELIIQFAIGQGRLKTISF